MGPAHLVRDVCCSVRSALAEQLKAKRQERVTPSVGQEAEMPDVHEAVWKQMQEEATQELIDR